MYDKKRSGIFKVYRNEPVASSSSSTRSRKIPKGRILGKVKNLVEPYICRQLFWGRSEVRDIGFFNVWCNLRQREYHLIPGNILA
ncbi:hypothetical protein CDW55_10485 [Chryseobacterium sp. VAUSW3]|nr:hypothetical protein CDW55_10485 [Chryseobacterium sp. VAUSW3]